MRGGKSKLDGADREASGVARRRRGRRSRPTVWRDRDFTLLWSGEAVSTLGSQISSVAYPLLVLALTHSAVDAGVIGFLNQLPWLLLGLPAGALADHWPRKRIMLLSDLVRALAVTSVVVALAVGALGFLQIAVAAVVEGSAYVFFAVCERGAVRQVVSSERVPEAIARLESKDYGAVVVGPAVGGVLFDLARLWPFVADAISYAGSFVALLLIRRQFQEPRANRERPRLKDVADGLTWIWQRPFLRTCQILVAGGNVFWGALYLTVIVIAKRDGASGSRIGLMLTIAGLGGLAGALLAPWLLRHISLRWTVVGSQWVKAALVPLLLISPNPLFMGLVVGSIQWVGPVWNAGIVGYRTAAAPDRLQGRIQGAASLIAQGASSIGPLAAGVALSELGSKATVIALLGLACAAALIATAAPSVRHAPVLAGARPDEEKAAADPAPKIHDERAGTQSSAP
jgi:predicted MFS family arabinose efflux permease